jgi:hypothetical protein
MVPPDKQFRCETCANLATAYKDALESWSSAIGALGRAVEARERRIPNVDFHIVGFWETARQMEVVVQARLIEIENHAKSHQS